MTSTTLTRRVDARPDEVFRLIVDPGRLPLWNAAIATVIDAAGRLTPGDEWVVEMRALGRHWPSRSCAPGA